jgi:hypothetical protein
VTHFAECIRERKTPISDGEVGLRVVRSLEAATRSIRAQGGRVILSQGNYGAYAGGYPGTYGSNGSHHGNGNHDGGKADARALRPGELLANR